MQAAHPLRLSISVRGAAVDAHTHLVDPQRRRPALHAIQSQLLHNREASSRHVLRQMGHMQARRRVNVGMSARTSLSADGGLTWHTLADAPPLTWRSLAQPSWLISTWPPCASSHSSRATWNDGPLNTRCLVRVCSLASVRCRGGRAAQR